MKPPHPFLAIILLLCAALVLAGCGAGQTPATPTNPPPTATPFPTFAFVEPTKAQVFEQTGSATAPADSSSGATEEDQIELDPVKVSRGQGRYEALDCAACHGAAGVGGDPGGSLLAFAMSEDDFITFVRSGGDLGTDHQYSTDRLSNSGSRNLYQYLLSLSRSG